MKIGEAEEARAREAEQEAERHRLATEAEAAEARRKADAEEARRKADAEIDWNKPVVEVYNLIRGTDPQPGAWTLFDGNELQIYDSRPGEGSGEPGTVLALTGDGFEVAARGGSIAIKRVRPKGGKKMDAGAFAREAGLREGARLGA